MAPLADIERRVLDAMDDREVVADLAALVAIPSVDGTDGEHEVQSWCAERMARLGLEVDHWRIDLAALRRDPDFPGMEVDRTEAWGCVATLPGADGGDRPALVLNGHVDVVPPGDLDRWPGRDPFAPRVVDGALWGRGACDMKGGVAAMFGAVAALRRAGVRLRRPLAVHTVIGEEDGGIGTFATLRRRHPGDACVIAEPTAGAVIPANGGSLTFRLEVPGAAAHGSTRTRGVSAVEKFERVHAALRVLEAARNAAVDPLFAHLDIAFPLSVGIVRAGDWASTVPDRLVAEGRYGVRLGEPVADATAVFEEAVAAACADDPWLADHPLTVTWPGGVFASGRLPEGHPLLGEVQRAAVDAGAAAKPKAHGMPSGSDLRQFAAAGVPTLQYGPGDVRFAHAVNEHVPLGDVAHCARAYALLAVRLCSPDPG
jgi:acetylornithine deacetylase